MIENEIIDGYTSITFDSWAEFSEFIMTVFVNYDYYVFRGHANENWLLESTFDRLLKTMNTKIEDADQIAFRHLSGFMKATRGRRGSNPARIDNEDDWWALGQHHGLATPLLDWSNSPFVASFFAFEDANLSSNVAVYALNMPAIVKKSNEIREMGKVKKRPEHIIFVSPFSDENPRLINQSGLFTRTPYLMDIKSWVNMHFSGLKEAYLIKFIIPSNEREVAIKALNRMNINHLSLFPDLSGASSFCNLALGMQHYHFT